FLFELLNLLHIFFFSSRRRHTRSDRDWSSDVCSSDLKIDVVHDLERRLDVVRDDNGSRTQRIAEPPDQIGDNPGGNRIKPGERRSEERRVGKECRSRWYVYNYYNNAHILHIQTYTNNN